MRKKCSDATSREMLAVNYVRTSSENVRLVSLTGGDPARRLEAA